MTYALAFRGASRAAAAFAALHRALVRAVLPPARVVQVGGSVVVALVRVDSDAEARTMATGLRECLAAELRDPDLSAGIGGPREREQSLRTVALHAEHALRLGGTRGGAAHVTAFRDLGPYCFVLGRPTAQIRSFSRAVLGPLADSAQREELRTLEEFLRSHGSVNGAARALFLHRNTVRARLKRISELTGADLEDADKRMTLYLAVLGHNALEQLAS